MSASDRMTVMKLLFFSRAAISATIQPRKHVSASTTRPSRIVSRIWETSGHTPGALICPATIVGTMRIQV